MRQAHRYPGAAGEAEGALAAELWELGASALELDGEDLVAYFAERRSVPRGGRWEQVDVSDHVAAYFEGLGPIDVGPLVVAPTHRAVTLEAGQKALWCDPGMAFGTGHHESTRLALGALGAMDLLGARVLDLGSGSGILAIAADLLGAGEALGLDIDDAALEEARSNARRNHSRARFRHADVTSLDTAACGLFDVVVANLYGELHAALMPTYAALTAPAGVALLSGILAERLGEVEARIGTPLTLRRRRRDGAWWLLELAHAEPPT